MSATEPVPYGMYGYDLVPAYLVPNKKEQKAIAHMLRFHSEGKSFREIGKWLDQHGYPAPRGGKWTAMSIRKIIDREGKK